MTESHLLGLQFQRENGRTHIPPCLSQNLGKKEQKAPEGSDRAPGGRSAPKDYLLVQVQVGKLSLNFLPCPLPSNSTFSLNPIHPSRPSGGSPLSEKSPLPHAGKVTSSMCCPGPCPTVKCSCLSPDSELLERSALRGPASSVVMAPGQMRRES